MKTQITKSSKKEAESHKEKLEQTNQLSQKFKDNRPQTTTQLKLQNLIDSYTSKKYDRINKQQTISPLQGMWIRVPVDDPIQERIESEAVHKMASQGDFMNAFKMHITTEPSIATEFHNITKLFFKNKTLYDTVSEVLELMHYNGEFSSSAVLGTLIQRLPLDQDASVEAYTSEIKATDTTTMDEGEKIAFLQHLITEKFIALGIPPPKIVVPDEIGGGRGGEFNSTTWSFSVSRGKLAMPVSEWASTAYHEARHAEQYFLMARLIVHEGITPPHSNQIPGAVLEKAAMNPPLEGAEKRKAEIFYHSIFGAHSKERDTTLKMLGVYTLDAVQKDLLSYKAHRADFDIKYEACKQYAALHKQNALDAGHQWPDSTQAENIRVMKLAREITEIAQERFSNTFEKQKSSYQNYVDLPEEKEAHYLGDKVKEILEEH